MRGSERRVLDVPDQTRTVPDRSGTSRTFIICFYMLDRRRPLCDVRGMAKCIVTAYLDHLYVERLDAEAARRSITRTALIREVLQARFPPPPEASDDAEEDESGE
jgi:hypothetical protein